MYIKMKITWKLLYLIFIIPDSNIVVNSDPVMKLSVISSNFVQLLL